MLACFAILVMVMIDQFIKGWAFMNLQHSGSMPVIQDVFHLTYVENRGAAFNILENKIWFFVIITTFILALIIYALYKKMIYTTLGKWSLYIIASGALGNLIDRIARGFVVDMFDFRLINFPVFNVADICVCVGGALFVFYFIVQHDKAENK